MSPCNKKSSCKKKRYFNAVPWLPAFLIAILPKCPFCIMAYSGAISMCSGKMIFPHADTTSSYILLGLSIVVLISILLNHKGKKTIIAGTLAFTGIIILLFSQFYFPSEPLYYLATALLFFGIWFNGSFEYFYKKYKKYIKIIKLTNENS